MCESDIILCYNKYFGSDLLEIVVKYESTFPLLILNK